MKEEKTMNLQTAVEAVNKELTRAGFTGVAKPRLGLICIGDREDSMDIRLANLPKLLKELKKCKKGAGDDRVWFALAGVPADYEEEDEDEDGFED